MADNSPFPVDFANSFLFYIISPLFLRTRNILLRAKLSLENCNVFSKHHVEKFHVHKLHPMCSIVAKFRGCAEAKFSYDPMCTRELEAVSIIQGKQSVDVEIEVCYCNGGKSNWDRNSSWQTIPHFQSTLPIVFTGFQQPVNRSLELVLW